MPQVLRRIHPAGLGTRTLGPGMHLFLYDHRLRGPILAGLIAGLGPAGVAEEDHRPWATAAPTMPAASGSPEPRALQPFALPLDLSPNQVRVFDRRWYALVYEAVSWSEAQRRCAALCGTLATVETAEEARFVSGMVAGIGVWLGASDAAAEGDWRWPDGRRLDFSQWGPGKPDGQTRENRLCLVPDAPGSPTSVWDDSDGIPGETVSGFLCEWDWFRCSGDPAADLRRARLHREWLRQIRVLFRSHPLAWEAERAAAELSLAIEAGELFLQARNLPAATDEPPQERLRLLQLAADRGNPYAQREMGDCYRLGDGVRADAAAACRWYRKAAEQGQVDARTWLGLGLLRDGQFDPPAEFSAEFRWWHEESLDAATPRGRQLAEARRWLELAARADDPLAAVYLGIMFHWGVAGAVDDQRAFAWFCRAIRGSDPRILALISGLIEEGLTWESGSDLQSPLALLRQPAEQGVPDAEFELGLLYLRGAGVEPDLDRAMSWLTEAARHGHSGATLELAYLALEGTGGDAADSPKAADLAGQVLEDEPRNWAAHELLGVCHADGRGVDPDADRAAAHFLEAAEAGAAVAQFRLGNLLYYGKSPLLNTQYAAPFRRSEATRWWKEAAWNGHLGALDSLAAHGLLGSRLPRMGRSYLRSLPPGDTDPEAAGAIDAITAALLQATTFSDAEALDRWCRQELHEPISSCFEDFTTCWRRFLDMQAARRYPRLGDVVTLRLLYGNPRSGCLNEVHDQYVTLSGLRVPHSQIRSDDLILVDHERQTAALEREFLEQRVPRYLKWRAALDEFARPRVYRRLRSVTADGTNQPPPGREAGVLALLNLRAFMLADRSTPPQRAPTAVVTYITREVAAARGELLARDHGLAPPASAAASAAGRGTRRPEPLGWSRAAVDSHGTGAAPRTAAGSPATNAIPRAQPPPRYPVYTAATTRTRPVRWRQD